MFEIFVDLDFTNDSGTYIMLTSEAHSENEWLFPPGTKFLINKIYPKIVSINTKKVLNREGEEVDEEYL